MAPLLHEEEVTSRTLAIALGASLLDTVTSGMYDNPLMAYREYVQNAADALDDALRLGVLKPCEGLIEVTLNASSRSVTIEDNGTGISAESAEVAMGSIGLSSKQRGTHRGFRGIGRLGGLAYCERVRFETRSNPDEPVCVVEWDAARMSSLCNSPRELGNLAASLGSLATIGFREPRARDGRSFFRVHLSGVEQFHSDVLMNPSAVRNYLCQIAPVGFSKSAFRFAEEIDSAMREVPGYRTYRLVVNGDEVLRPYEDSLNFADKRTVGIRSIEYVEISAADGSRMGRGWFADTGFPGALGRSLPAAGIRVREGNIQVMDGRFMEPFCTESRFAAWHIGEIHVGTGTLSPNARRDGFVQSRDYERFLEQLVVLGRHLSSLCRHASQLRGVLRRIEELDAGLLRAGFFVDADHRMMTTGKEVSRLRAMAGRQTASRMKDEIRHGCERVIADLERFGREAPLLEDVIDGRRLPRGSAKHLLQALCRRVLDAYEATDTAEELIELVTEPYRNTRRWGRD